MLADDISDPADLTPSDLRQQYEDAVRAAARTVGRDDVATVTDLDEASITALLEETEVELSLSDAAAILARAEGSDADRMLQTVRDRLLFDMSTAILDVDALAGDLDLDLDPQEVQRRVEGREPMTLEEYAHLRHRIARGNR